MENLLTNILETYNTVHLNDYTCLMPPRSKDENVTGTFYTGRL